MPQSNRAWAMISTKDVEVDDQGLIYAPEQPGLGYEIDWELVKRETVQVVK